MVHDFGYILIRIFNTDQINIYLKLIETTVMLRTQRLSVSRKGTIVDEIGLPTDNKSVYNVKVSLMGDKVACPVCEKKEIHFFFITLGDLDKHFIEHHIDTPFNAYVLNVKRASKNCMGRDVTYLNVEALR
jgi:hypothetical protein